MYVTVYLYYLINARSFLTKLCLKSILCVWLNQVYYYVEFRSIYYLTSVILHQYLIKHPKLCFVSIYLYILALLTTTPSCYSNRPSLLHSNRSNNKLSWGAWCTYLVMTDSYGNSLSSCSGCFAQQIAVRPLFTAWNLLYSLSWGPLCFAWGVILN